jgi:hypothetical protein
MKWSTGSILDLEFKTLDTPVITSTSLSMPMPITDSVSRDAFSLNLAPSVDLLEAEVFSTHLSVFSLPSRSPEISKSFNFK